MSVSATSSIIDLWVIYDSPPDYPGEFVARRFEVSKTASGPTNEAKRAATLDGVRAQLPQGKFIIPRNPDDHKSIVEVWV